MSILHNRKLFGQGCNKFRRSPPFRKQVNKPVDEKRVRRRSVVAILGFQRRLNSVEDDSFDINLFDFVHEAAAALKRFV